MLRQEAVRELRGRVDLRERVATLGEFEFFESKWSTFEGWLKSPKFSFARPVPILAFITSALLAGLVLAGFDALIPWRSVAVWISFLVALHAGAGLFFRGRVNRMLEFVRPISYETRVLREGLHLLETEQFRSVKLRRLAEQVRDGSRIHSETGTATGRARSAG